MIHCRFAKTHASWTIRGSYTGRLPFCIIAYVISCIWTEQTLGTQSPAITGRKPLIMPMSSICCTTLLQPLLVPQIIRHLPRMLDLLLLDAPDPLPLNPIRINQRLQLRPDLFDAGDIVGGSGSKCKSQVLAFWLFVVRERRWGRGRGSVADLV